MVEGDASNGGGGQQTYSNPYDDPLYLSASDYPGMTLVNTVFNGRNYLHWSRGIVLALSSKNKEGFLTGKTSMPATNSDKLPQWKRCDNMVRCWLLNTLSVDIKEGFMSSKSAKLLWDEISERYGQSNVGMSLGRGGGGGRVPRTRLHQSPPTSTPAPPPVAGDHSSSTTRLTGIF
ncbi:hypothetical protein RND81_11G055200 [Saponaria officinalis]|uniref:Retrotransposon Copia-like N-terminal domain-containing protein n=1 Tax=Saponaria officinalis TaxID=3572 RepID=A0AAW1HIP2_SAPOF